MQNVEQLAGSPAFRALRDRIVELARLRAEDRVLDIGAGTGLLTLAAATHVRHVSAVDVSPAMCARLRHNLDRLAIGNVDVLAGSATELPLAERSVDVVVSNYCFHHLDEGAKRQAIAEIARVLRPGGRLVFADMMFTLALADRRNRAVIALLVKRVLRHGVSGVARLAKNAARIATGRWERPASLDWWREALLAGGFTEVSVRELEHEGGIACARAPLPRADRGERPARRALAGP